MTEQSFLDTIMQLGFNLVIERQADGMQMEINESEGDDSLFESITNTMREMMAKPIDA